MMEILMLIALYYIIVFAISVSKNIEIDNNINIDIDENEDINLDSQRNKYTDYIIYKNLRK